MARPKAKVELSLPYRIMELTGAASIVLMFVFLLYYFKELPEIIPIHFNAKGEPDGFSQKNMVWVLPTIALVTYIGLVFIKNYPHFLNYPIKITSDNAQRQYRIAIKLISTLNMIIAVSIFYISYSTVQVALGKETGLGTYFLPITIVTLLGPTGIFLYHSIKNR